VVSSQSFVFQERSVVYLTTVVLSRQALRAAHAGVEPTSAAKRPPRKPQPDQARLYGTCHIVFCFGSLLRFSLIVPIDSSFEVMIERMNASLTLTVLLHVAAILASSLPQSCYHGCTRINDTLANDSVAQHNSFRRSTSDNRHTDHDDTWRRTML
jgi:hypothetical protein